ncbi:T9SS type A sorting domain-containing protein [Pontimicrobium aquaticum]|nr:T9SS type A sorting domain-containing protein [Pontimicrobium aquaticum]
MKHKYFLIFLLAVLSFNDINSQTCPEVSFVLEQPTQQVIFAFDDPGPSCASRPTAIVIDGSAFVLGNCDTYSSRYILSSGSGVLDPNNYSVTYGGSTCDYNGGTLLGLDDSFHINKTLKLFPNPITSTNELTVSFAINASAKISVYTLLGKEVMHEKLINEKSKKIDISSLSNGMYLMQLKLNNLTVTKKFVVNN